MIIFASINAGLASVPFRLRGNRFLPVTVVKTLRHGGAVTVPRCEVTQPLFFAAEITRSMVNSSNHK